MTRILIFILSVTIVISCVEQTEHIATKKPRLYFGDSLLTISFLQESDTTYRTALENNEFSEMSVLGYSGDTTIVVVCKDLVAGVYNGAGEIKNDTLNLNYWLDSSDCISAMVHSRITYKVKKKNIQAGKTKINFIKTKSPLRKSCE